MHSCFVGFSSLTLLASHPSHCLALYAAVQTTESKFIIWLQPKAVVYLQFTSVAITRLGKAVEKSGLLLK